MEALVCRECPGGRRSLRRALAEHLMTRTKIKTTSWKDVRKRAVKPEDEPLIAREREALEAELRLAALRRRRKASQATVAKRLWRSPSRMSPSSSAGLIPASLPWRATWMRSAASLRSSPCSATIESCSESRATRRTAVWP
jgi:hypothetical protein